MLCSKIHSPPHKKRVIQNNSSQKIDLFIKYLGVLIHWFLSNINYNSSDFYYSDWKVLSLGFCSILFVFYIMITQHMYYSRLVWDHLTKCVSSGNTIVRASELEVNAFWTFFYLLFMNEVNRFFVSLFTSAFLATVSLHVNSFNSYWKIYTLYFSLF